MIVTKEIIKEEVEKVPDERLSELYQIVKNFSQPEKKSKETFMTKMRKIKIDAPPDSSRNIDLYLNGEKTIE